jgi:hypothetical protein
MTTAAPSPPWPSSAPEISSSGPRAAPGSIVVSSASSIRRWRRGSRAPRHIRPSPTSPTTWSSTATSIPGGVVGLHVLDVLAYCLPAAQCRVGSPATIAVPGGGSRGDGAEWLGCACQYCLLAQVESSQYLAVPEPGGSLGAGCSPWVSGGLRGILTARRSRHRRCPARERRLRRWGPICWMGCRRRKRRRSGPAGRRA